MFIVLEDRKEDAFLFEKLKKKKKRNETKRGELSFLSFSRFALYTATIPTIAVTAVISRVSRIFRAVSGVVFLCLAPPFYSNTRFSRTSRGSKSLASSFAFPLGDRRWIEIR